MTAWIFRRNLAKARVFFWTGAALAATLAFAISFRTVFYAVGLKVVELALEGGGPGGRGIGVLFDYLRRYPLGMSYGGSSLRIGPGMEEINSGIFAFISQLSFLSIPLVGLLIFLEAKVIRESRRIATPYFRSVLTMGAVMMLIIFSADPLWFVPTIWLPVILCEHMSSIPGSRFVPAVRDLPVTA